MDAAHSPEAAFAVGTLEFDAVREQLARHASFSAGRELALQFGVSRALIHQALRVLEHSGLVVTRTGAHGGTFVQRPAGDQVTRELGILIRTGGVGLAELSEVRVILEGQNAAWAAKRASPQHLERMADVVQRLQALAAAGGVSLGAVGALDVEFHVIVAEAAHNKMSEAFVKGIVPAVRELIGLLPPNLEHAAAVQMSETQGAILAGDSRRARASMVRHIEYFARILTRTP